MNIALVFTGLLIFAVGFVFGIVTMILVNIDRRLKRMRDILKVFENVKDEWLQELEKGDK